jgi:hypothetical protein
MAIVLDGTSGITTPTIAATSASTFTGALALPSGGLNVGSGQLAVDASGRVTMSSQPAFSAYITSTVTAYGVIPINLTHVNTGSHYNTSTYRFTAPVTGNYLITAGSAASSAAYADFAIRLNGAEYTNGVFGNNCNDNAGYPSDSRSIVMPLVAGDYVQLNYNGSSPANSSIRQSYTVFSGFLIG